jgi:hypothetical protein
MFIIKCNVEKISLRIFKYLAIQVLYTLVINIIIYYDIDIIELMNNNNSDGIVKVLIRVSLFLGWSAMSVFYYSKFYEHSWLKLKRKFIKNEIVENNANLNDNDSVINIDTELKPPIINEDGSFRHSIVDVGGLNDPDNIERVYLLKAIIFSIIAVVVKNGWY